MSTWISSLTFHNVERNTFGATFSLIRIDIIVCKSKKCIDKLIIYYLIDKLINY